MFEKEAEKYIDKLTKDWSDGEYSFSVEELRQAILHFAEFSYNKANNQLTKAKELLAKWVLTSNASDCDIINIVEETEQFLSEVEKC